MKALPSAQLALGIDPEAESLSELKERTESHNTLLQLDSTQHQISWIKPNLQFFLKFGAAGLELLERSVRLWKSWGYRCLLDAKFSEMDNSLRGSLHFSFQVLKADALTLNPFLGEKPLLFAAEKCMEAQASHLFVLCQTSQQSEGALQYFQNQPATLLRTLSEIEAGLKKKTHSSTGSSQDGPVSSVFGAVVGANRLVGFPEQTGTGFRGPLLCPGLGAQGADLSVLTRYPGSPCLFPVSRGIFQGGASSLADQRSQLDHFAGLIQCLKDNWDQSISL